MKTVGKCAVLIAALCGAHPVLASKPHDIGAEVAAVLPPGIIIKESSDGLILAMASGELVYQLDFDRGPAADRRRDLAKARCANFCNRHWAPVLASRRFTATGKWTIVDQPAGQQLAYDGAPLYRFIGGTMDVLGKVPVFPPYFSGYSKSAAALVNGVPNGSRYWQTVPYRPAAPRIMAPAGVTPRWSGKAFILSDSSGKSLYLSADGKPCAPACADVEPLKAPLAAEPVGEWRPIDSEDGVRRWTYRGTPVYRARGDTVPDEAAFKPMEVG
ncbi:hypothetical protein [Sphingobium tyrosinilyticum]|uniref:Lipoprotein n=1 Tax=Sphingobium tyrosinilyticum TaxID=2715436 RepID=A0ABV9F1Q5_9SPHN